MNESPSPALWSTVAVLPDYLLLAQTRQLARHEQALQILVLDHLREIEARGLHLTRGYGSLFDYVVHELGYTAAAAWRRIKAMRLCSATSGARELLQDGKLNLSNAAQLQNLFERSDRNHGRPPGGDGLGGEPRSDGAPGEPASSRAGERDPAPAAGPVLDAAAREELVKQAAGKSTREVQQMVAEVAPELARTNDRMRALGGGRWELKATIDAECRHGLEKLQMLLSHRDPHLTLGGLVARLVRDGLDRYDPARPPRARRGGGRNSVSGERSVSKPARRGPEAAQRSVARAKGGDVGLRSEFERGDASVAVVRDGAPGPSAAKRRAEAEPGGAKSAAVPQIVRHTDSAPKRPAPPDHRRESPAAIPKSGGSTDSAAKRHGQAALGRASHAAARDGGGRTVSPAKSDTEAERGGAKSVAEREIVHGTDSAPKRPSEAEPGNVSPSAAPNSGRHTASAAKRHGQAEIGRASHTAAQDGGGPEDSAAKRVGQDAHMEEAERVRGGAVSAPGRRRNAEHACGQPKAIHGNGGRVASLAKRHGHADGDGRGEGTCGVPGRATCAAEPHIEAGERSAARASVRGRHRFTSAAATRLADGAGHGAAATPERSPALERHLAALSCFGAWPGSRSRYIPAAVRREVWRRDQGCCSYVARHSGRRCGSRYRLEIDHIVPFALGGGAEPGNLTLRCRAHHRYRHAQGHAHPHPASVPTETRCAPSSEVDLANADVRARA